MKMNSACIEKKKRENKGNDESFLNTDELVEYEMVRLGNLDRF